MDFTPHTDAEITEMLRVIGVSSIDELFHAIRDDFKAGELKIPGPLSEAEVVATLRAMSENNRTGTQVTSFLGAGAYDHYVPAAVHHLLSRGEFLTAYTPYQPEVAQGTLQAQFEYQTMVAGLLGMDVANASMYEGATALAEGVLMCLRQARRATVLVSRAVHPEYRDVLRTYVGAANVVEVGVDATGATDVAALAAAMGPDVGCIAIQSPNFFGVVEDVAAAAKLAHDAKALLVATFTEPLAFGLVEAPGNLGADIAAGEGQSLGLPLSFGGPYLGLFAVKQPLVKGMPGRLIGRTKDSRGTPCYTLTLAAREQHIRRERASSNICSNEGLCAVGVAIWLSLLGRQGFAKLALYNHARAEKLKGLLAARGIAAAFSGPTFNEFVVTLDQPASALVERLGAQGMLIGVPLSRFYPEYPDRLLITVTERRTDADFDRLVAALA